MLLILFYYTLILSGFFFPINLLPFALAEEGEHQYSHGQSMERDRGWRNRMITGVGGREGYDGDHLGGDDDDDDT